MSKEIDKSEDEPRLKSPSQNIDNKDEGKKKGERFGKYLQRFEYHQPTGRPYFQLSGIPYIPLPVGSKAEIMKKKLLSQEIVTVFIPRKEGESDKVLQTVNLNGYHLELPKQTYLELPKQIVDILKESLKQDEEALRAFRIDTPQKEQALL